MRKPSDKERAEKGTRARKQRLSVRFESSLTLDSGSPQSSRNHRIVVGVDYGTTYTGISYIESTTDASTCSVKDVHDVRKYPGPGREGNSPWKTPSRIAYQSENEGCQKNQFGYQVLPKMVGYSWTKLLLDQKALLTAFDDPALRRIEGDGLMRLPADKTAVQVVTDFLSEIYAWFISYMEHKITPELLAVTPIEFWFTIPAIWSDQAKSATMTAAKDAGFGSRSNDRIFLIPEPEAAAISVIKGLSEKQPGTAVTPGDVIMVCDCGGGTVDLTSYEIVTTSPILEFEEVVEGIGGKCGSTYIDREFHRWMSNTFGSDFDELKFEKIGPGSHFMKDFELEKCDFGSDHNLDRVSDVRLIMPNAEDSEYYDADESTVKLPGHVMKKFFEPVIEKVLQLLGQQVALITTVGKSAALKRIILAGGFGDSPYLHRKVKEWGLARGLSTLCPEHPQAAIVRGAALHGLECIGPIRRRSRRHYGFETLEVFREGIDPEEDAEICPWTGAKECRRRMTWPIAKGQMIDENTNIEVKRRRYFGASEDLIHTIKLYSCSQDTPPERSSDSGTEEVAELTYTLDASRLSQFDQRVINGEVYYNLYYQRHIYLGATQGTLLFKVFSNGEEWARSEIKYKTM